MKRYWWFVRWFVPVALMLGLAACTPMGPMGPGMGPDHMRGMMGRGMMGRGMMGQGGTPPPVTPVPTATPGGSATVSYNRDVQPIFNQNCISCHGGSLGLWLDSYEHVMAGSERGPVVVPGDPDASELYRRVTGVSQPAMPLGLPPLPEKDIETLRQWIAEGAPKN
jgi:mono/diheme cytochrome c family protein